MAKTINACPFCFIEDQPSLIRILNKLVELFRRNYVPLSGKGKRGIEFRTIFILEKQVRDHYVMNELCCALANHTTVFVYLLKHLLANM